jgi:hypothetical protein
MSDKEIGWLWLPAHTGVEIGQTLTTEGPLKYASPRALDALAHASGPVICRISSSGKVLAMADATKVLHEFMCWSGEQALLGEREAGREPDKQSWAAIETKRKWLEGKATDEELIATYTAAYIASSNAAWDMTKGSIGNSTWGATWRAAWDAANTAARKATWLTPWTGAWDVAWDVASAAAWAATWAATSKEIWKAAWDAAWDAQNAKLEEMLNDLLKEGEGK